MTASAEWCTAMQENPTDRDRIIKITGRGGEDAACRFLESNGYSIICRNYRAGHDEIDIIAENSQYIVFVEVKTRTEVKRSSFGRPSNAVNYAKRKCLARAAERYRKSRESSKFYRFDVIEVLVCSDKNTGEGSYKINHMKGVFGASGKIWI